MKDGRHTQRIHNADGGHPFDGIQIDPLIRRIDPATDVNPGTRRIIHRSAVHRLRFAAFTEFGLTRRLLYGPENLITGEVHHPAGVGTIDPGFRQQVYGGLKYSVREIVIGIDDGFFVPLDPMTQDHLRQFGNKTTHVVIRIGYQQALVRPVEHLNQIDHPPTLLSGLAPVPTNDSAISTAA